MEDLVKGDVVILNFPFSDLSATKRRPAFVLANLGDGDIVLCQITSKPAKNEFSIRIEQNDFEASSLPIVSFVRTDKFFTADKELILYKAGHIKQEKIDKVIQTAISVISKT
ncbi:MAG: type II toxin-antitoxin system PemK/MazF family toxin [Fibromonadaceae bacterium]|jgi:mRNA interferase MazF|nr:type II toxin-antitoxin system PemK/MazF family toxin [Fibromonadaceae bacterium]